MGSREQQCEGHGQGASAPDQEGSTGAMGGGETITGPAVDDYGGTKVPDPYRWMESLDSKEVASWVAAENWRSDSSLVVRKDCPW